MSSFERFPDTQEFSGNPLIGIRDDFINDRVPEYPDGHDPWRRELGIPIGTGHPTDQRTWIDEGHVALNSDWADRNPTPDY